MSTKPKLLKRLSKHPITLGLGCRLIWLYIWCVFLTSKIRMEVHPLAQPFIQGQDNAIFGFWHGRLAMIARIRPPQRGMHVLISHHRDGQLIARVMEHFGIATVHGSSSKGALAAIRQMYALLKAGENVTITPDGPRGPFQIAASGAAHIAFKSGKPFIPVAFCATHHKRLRSWDKFMLPKPFTTILYIIGEPVLPQPDPHATIEDYRVRIESALIHVTDHADTLAGVTITR